MQFEYSVDTGDLQAYIGVAVLEAEMERTLQPFKAAPLSPITFIEEIPLADLSAKADSNAEESWSVCMDVLRAGGDPRQWLSDWIREKKLDSGDRLCRELRSLIEVLYLGGVYDHLNDGSVLCLEAASRRVKAIVEAYSMSSVQPQCWLAKYFTGDVNAEDGLREELRSHATKLAKEEYDFQAARTKSRGLPSSSADGDGGGASHYEGAPKGDTKGRGRGGRGRGKFLAAAEEQ
jgi:hypothetical protein